MWEAGWLLSVEVIAMNRHRRIRKNQEGAVLLVALLMLLVTTFIGFSAMETSNLQAKMAMSREIKVMTFQTAEVAIERSLGNLGLLSTAFTASLQPDPVWPVDPQTFDRDGDGVYELNTSTTVEFLSTVNTLGYSIRKGASGIATYYYEVVATASLINSNITSVHTQGIYVEGPSLS